MDGYPNVELVDTDAAELPGQEAVELLEAQNQEPNALPSGRSSIVRLVSITSRSISSDVITILLYVYLSDFSYPVEWFYRRS